MRRKFSSKFLPTAREPGGKPLPTVEFLDAPGGLHGNLRCARILIETCSLTFI